MDVTSPPGDHAASEFIPGATARLEFPGKDQRRAAFPLAEALVGDGRVVPEEAHGEIEFGRAHQLRQPARPPCRAQDAGQPDVAAEAALEIIVPAHAEFGREAYRP